MKKILLALVLLVAPSLYAQQPWSAILSPSRAIDWSGAGLPQTFPDGETWGGNPWTPPTGRTQCGATIAAYSGTAATINNALIACAGLGGRFVLLGPGTFTISTDIWFRVVGGNALSAVTLRGSGAGGTNQTKINFTGNAQLRFGVAWNNGICTWTAGFATGTTALTTSGCSGPALQTGSMINLMQCDTGFTGPIGSCTTGATFDNGGMYVCGETVGCQQPGQPTSPTKKNQNQTVFVTSVAGSTVNISPGVKLPNFNTGNAASVNWTTTANGNSVEAYGNGLEDLTIHSSGAASPTGIIEFAGNYASWIKGVRIVGVTDTTTVRINNAKNLLMANNYIDTNFESAGGPPQSTFLHGTDSDVLFLNNIFVGGTIGYGTGSSTGEVLAYNYGRDTQTDYVEISEFQHQAGGAFSLYEGNNWGKSNEDATHGTHNLNTWFREYHKGWDEPYSIYTNGNVACASSSCDTVGIDDYARFDNVIGSALGFSTYIFNYEHTTGFTNNTVFVFDQTSLGDTLAKASLMRWGNCDTATTTCRFVNSEVPTVLPGNAAPFQNTVPVNHNLPCSFFLQGFNATSCSPFPTGGTGLSWWKVCKTWTTFPTSCASTQTPPFPTTGPDVSGGPYVFGHAYDNPAAVAWKNLPIDPAYQVNYTITGSSWSAGTETLVLSSGPGLHRFLGGFQLTGVPAACNPSGGELFITASTANTAKYALAVNPNVQCTGTFKFPDVRQFDERVYLLDSPGTPTAATPTASPAAGTYPSSQNVTLSTTSAGAIICYTTNGQIPATNGGTVCTTGTKYTTPIAVTTTTTILAKAGGTGYVDSSTLTAAYTISQTAVAPTFVPGTGTYTSTQNVTISSTSVGAIKCYTTNGATPVTNGAVCSSGTLYASPVAISTLTTLKAVAGGTGFIDSSVSQAVYSFQATTPTAAPPAGTYTGTQNVALSKVTGTVICYTTDGSTPVTNSGAGCAPGSTLYSTPISVTSSLTIKAVSGGTNFVDSAVGSFAYVINNTAAMPTFSPVAGTYPGTQNVTITSTSGTAIKCYTTNGTNPVTNTGVGCTSGILYSGPVSIASTLTLKAVAGGTGFADSTVASGLYTITSPVATPTFSPVAGTYNAPQNVTISTGTAGATLCYTIDGSNPTANGAGTCTHGIPFTVPVVVSTSQTLKALGTKAGNVDSAVASSGYVITIPTTAATPTATPAAGTYSGTQNVTLATTSPGAIICYTTNGTVPQTNGATNCTVGTLYTTPVAVNISLTLNARAGGTGYVDSSTLSAIYTINSVAAAPSLLPGTGTYMTTQSVVISSTSVGAIKCYTTNGTNPSTNGGAICTNGILYTVPITISAVTTLKAIAGGTGYTDSAITTGVYTFQATVPIANPGAGSYNSSQNVALTTATGSVICYTTNGSNPQTNGGAGCNAGIIYTVPIAIASNLTLKAISGGTGFVDSALVSFAYVISTAPPPAPAINMFAVNVNGANYTVTAKWTDTPGNSTTWTVWVPSSNAMSNTQVTTDGNYSISQSFKGTPGSQACFSACNQSACSSRCGN